MIGRVVSRFRIVEALGQGGMGIVYRAVDDRLDRSVALKFLPAGTAGDPEARERFLREARAASALDHPNVCTVYDVGETSEGELYLAMAYYSGETIARRLARGPLPAEEVREIVTQVLRGLEAAHRAGIVHRDLKPENLLRTDDGLVKILDFGLARRPASGDGVTRVGMIVGTLGSMAPEQLRAGELDGRTDLWAVGVLAYRLLYGRRPFVGDHDAAVMSAILEAPPRTPPDEVSVPDDLRRLVDGCLRKDPSARWRSAEECLRLLEAGRAEVSEHARTRMLDAVETEPPAESSVVVFDFATRSSDPADEWLGPAVAETLHTDLRKVEALRVVSRDRVTRLASGRAPEGVDAVLSLARSARARTAIWGTCQILGPAVRVSAEILDVVEGEPAGSARVDGRLDEIFALQDELVRRVFAELDVEASPSEARRLEEPDTLDLEAWELYARGRQEVLRMNPESLQRALELFEEALERDPDYALARAGLGQVRLMRFIARTNERDLEAGIEALEGCLAVDDRLADPWGWLAYGRLRRGDSAGAIQAASRAVEIEPAHPLGRYMLGIALHRASWEEGDPAGRRRAEGHLKECLRHHPRFQSARMVLAWVLASLGRTREALAEADRAEEIEASGDFEQSRFVGAATLRALLRWRLGDLEAARAALDRSFERLEGENHVYARTFEALGWWGLGRVELSAGQNDLALSAFRRAAAMATEHPRALGIGWIAVRTELGRAAACAGLGMTAEREQALGRADDLMESGDLDFQWVWEGERVLVEVDRAGCEALAGRFDDAKERLGRAVETGLLDDRLVRADRGLQRLEGDPDFDDLLRQMESRSAGLGGDAG